VLSPSYPIETERLLLRPFEEADFDQLLDMHSRPEVARYLYWEPRRAEDLRAVFADKASGTQLSKEGDWLCLAATRRDDGAVVGDINLIWESEQHGQAEIGFIIHPDHQRQGFATEAIGAMLALGFEGLGVHRIAGSCDARNEASAGVMERVGMRREAHLVENEFVKDEWQSELIYAILEAEWRERARQSPAG
jgi:RimJ/RimL family protein N-acetyltransferase